MIQIIIQIEEIKPDQVAIDVGKNSDLKGTPSPREIQMALRINNRIATLLPALVQSHDAIVEALADASTEDDQLNKQIIRSMIEGERNKST